MDTRLFQIDPMAASSYGLYKSIKKDDASFEDFLLSYDSHGANEGDNSWLTKLLGVDILSTLSSPDMLNVMNYANINSYDFFSSMDYFDTKAQLYTLMVKQEIAKREISSDSSPLLSLLSLKSVL